MRYEESMQVVNRGKCSDCKRPVIWGRLQNGRSRTFQPDLVKASEVPAEKERFAVRRGEPYVIDLEGIRHSPDMLVLVPHYCAEYRERRQNRNVDSLADLLPSDD
ncbi:hypothetical protein OOJ91_33930 [Micromonospora lupini]|uniref:hypothetical protein n=1 Tax=Micromonospora lupini TaxID=285679 RepID=UPI002259E344|nr:hypothetical protein [Micromonospora lupini]MCX5070848.1 hypothetical protein [Micromonospora lupini]